MKRKRKVKRSHMKRFSASMINTGQRVNSEVIREYQQRARHRDDLFARIFGFTGMGGEARQAALERSKELLDEPDVIRFYAFGKLMLCFNEKRTKFFFVDKDLIRGCVKRSVVYNSKLRATQAMGYNKIVWVEVYRTLLPNLSTA